MSFSSLLRLTLIWGWLALVAIVIAKYALSLQGIHESGGAGGDRLGRDFINFWASGKAFWEDKVSLLYDHEKYRSYLISKFSEPLNRYSFSYPPHSLFTFAPFGALPYFPALVLWSGGGLLALYTALRGYKIPISPLYIFLAPATVICLLSGQTGLWIAALFIGGLVLAPNKPILAGVLFGLLTIKPQFGPLLVLALILSAQWRVIITASITAISLGLASILFFGLDSWMIYIGETLPHQSDIVAGPYGIFDYMVPSIFKWVINLEAGLTLAWFAQAIVMIFSIVGTFILFRSKEDWSVKVAGLCVLTFLFSPYIAIYDMPLLFPAIFLMWKTKPVLAWLALSLPAIGMIAAIYYIPLSQITLIAMAAYFVIGSRNVSV